MSPRSGTDPRGRHRPARRDTAPDLSAEHGYPTIGLARVLEAVDGDRPLRDLRLVIAGVRWPSS